MLFIMGMIKSTIFHCLYHVKINFCHSYLQIMLIISKDYGTFYYIFLLSVTTSILFRI